MLDISIQRNKIMKSNWQTKKLSEICETASGGTPLKSHKEYYENGSIPWLRSGEVCRKEITESVLFISEKGLKKSSARIFPKNTLLIAMYGATAGQVGILRFESSTNQAVCGVLPNGKILPEFLYYFFLDEKESLINKATGNAQPNISQIKIKNTQIPLPTIQEQKRIVKVLDEVFNKIEKVKENAEKNLQNSKVLFESYLQSIVVNPKKEWEIKKIKDICDKLFAGGDVPKKNLSKFKTEKYSIPIYANGFKDKGLYGYTDKKKVEEPSITISARGTIGYAEVREEPFFPVVRLIVLTPKETMDLYFLYYITHNFKFSNTGTSIPQLTIPMIENIEIPVPTIKEQKAIVKKLDELSEQTKKLEIIYKKKLADLEELKKSVLKKAFAGEL